jgi:CDP-glucose 4,6-dehydratase
MSAFKNVYENKRVLVTGHTGFKGSWLTLWLVRLGAEVSGFSSYLPSNPSNYEVLELKKRIKDYSGDVRNLGDLEKAFDEFQPEIIFHLAAQAIVRRSFDDPKLTFDTNLGGTVNLLECIRKTPSVETAVIITSDKCYQNLEWTWGYRENDRLGGDDPYSASKACAEMAFHAYYESFFCKPQSKRSVSMATTRAGNVIGGGDWAEDRILPDCVRAWTGGEKVLIRSPGATRPWQHVLDPLSGYLSLGAKLLGSNEFHGESFNFGPGQHVNKTVKELIETFLSHWGKGSWRQLESEPTKDENILLKLSCDKALHYLDWRTVLSFEDAVRLTAQWYRRFYDAQDDMYEYSSNQIDYYVAEASRKKLSWVKEA